MTNRILLFKNFNAELPKEFINRLKVACQDAVIYTVQGKYDFNRWELNYRINPAVLECVALTNKKHDNILDSILEIVTISSDPFSGFIEFDDNGKEHWKQ
jgi:hypothetical protein